MIGCSTFQQFGVVFRLGITISLVEGLSSLGLLSHEICHGNKLKIGLIVILYCHVSIQLITGTGSLKGVINQSLISSCIFVKQKVLEMSIVKLKNDVGKINSFVDLYIVENLEVFYCIFDSLNLKVDNR